MPLPERFMTGRSPIGGNLRKKRKRKRKQIEGRNIEIKRVGKRNRRGGNREHDSKPEKNSGVLVRSGGAPQLAEMQERLRSLKKQLNLPPKTVSVENVHVGNSLGDGCRKQNPF